MKYFIFVLFLFMIGGCSSWQNSRLAPNADISAAYKKDRLECLNRAKKQAHSEPGTEYLRLRNYDAVHGEYKDEINAYNRCMSSKGWVKK